MTTGSPPSRFTLVPSLRTSSVEQYQIIRHHIRVNMIHYPDGTDARIGDELVLAHGVHKGVVTQVIDSEKDIEAWDIDEPGLLVDTSYGGLVLLPVSQITVDEVAFLRRNPA